ncbi:hypothetical protein IW261DRAFT_1412906 [Armillaria novae-zelandiae]|uniref:Uncharacterized protein n=1 Tax=Armillaria novae-zelandiae TaxID=153914 RepID=A0AA39PTN6_9AGAR|nr:hypothetical protein IW261DRAFT_1412906 [Armillaria novae-zelandiae]
MNEGIIREHLDASTKLKTARSGAGTPESSSSNLGWNLCTAILGGDLLLGLRHLGRTNVTRITFEQASLPIASGAQYQRDILTILLGIHPGFRFTSACDHLRQAFANIITGHKPTVSMSQETGEDPIPCFVAPLRASADPGEVGEGGSNGGRGCQWSACGGERRRSTRTPINTAIPLWTSTSILIPNACKKSIEGITEEKKQGGGDGEGREEWAGQRTITGHDTRSRRNMWQYFWMGMQAYFIELPTLNVAHRVSQGSRCGMISNEISVNTAAPKKVFDALSVLRTARTPEVTQELSAVRESLVTQSAQLSYA